MLELRGWQLAKGKQTAALHGQVYQRSPMGIFFFLALPRIVRRRASASEVSSDFL